ncbi:hypothetical protein C1645_880699 [Glomus cerebriforme]|uniref:Uncharacterized protein n=1 Tax=Glomus cerebriforme TaxID=658196 RepID=A0A397SC79_9GLOM|nr:hypothetical protein C1645_880699 [Glomus cerebriforme]
MAEHLREKGMLKIDDPDNLNLWKVDLSDNLKDIITEEQIKNKGKELNAEVVMDAEVEDVMNPLVANEPLILTSRKLWNKPYDKWLSLYEYSEYLHNDSLVADKYNLMNQYYKQNLSVDNNYPWV